MCLDEKFSTAEEIWDKTKKYISQSFPFSIFVTMRFKGETTHVKDNKYFNKSKLLYGTILINLTEPEYSKVKENLLKC